MVHRFSRMKFGRPYCLYRIPRHRRKYSRWAVAVLIISAVVYAFTAAAAALSPAVEKVCEKVLEINGAKVINLAVEKTVKEGISYESLTDISYSPEGSVLSVSLRPREMNRLKAELTSQVLAGIEQMGEKGFSIPLGSLTDILLFSGIGPDIPFKIIPYGAATIDFRNSFTASGINQTRHEIYIDISAELHAMSSVSDVKAVVSTSVMAAQTVIVGKIPQFLMD